MKWKVKVRTKRKTFPFLIHQREILLSEAEKQFYLVAEIFYKIKVNEGAKGHFKGHRNKTKARPNGEFKRSVKCLIVMIWSMSLHVTCHMSYGPYDMLHIVWEISYVISDTAYALDKIHIG